MFSTVTSLKSFLTFNIFNAVRFHFSSSFNFMWCRTCAVQVFLPNIEFFFKQEKYFLASFLYSGSIYVFDHRTVLQNHIRELILLSVLLYKKKSTLGLNTVFRCCSTYKYEIAKCAAKRISSKIKERYQSSMYIKTRTI